MTQRNDPWAEIVPDTPAGELRARRADSSHPHGFFWARDAKGKCLLVFQSQALNLQKSFPLLKGIGVELEKDRLLLRLVENNDIELFTTLCWSLIERTRHIDAEDQVVNAILTHLERWQRFLGKAPNGLLSDLEIRGLFGELTFLDSELMTRFGCDAVSFWHGPAGYPQDFAIGTTLFEVKSRLAGASPVVLISSPEQLWYEAGRLYLAVYTIGLASEHTVGSLSLTQLIAKIRTTLAGSELFDVFEGRLMEAGYVDHPEYGMKHYSISPPDFFEIREGFPRITAAALPQGICRVSYGVEIAGCLPFRVNPDWSSLGEHRGT